MSQPDSASDWEQVPEDPDPEGDLGYEGEDWDVINVDQQGNEHVVFLPQEEDDVWKEEFLIVEKGDVCDPLDMR